jgi:hypothetical protein
MRKTGVLVAVLMFAMTGVALAALPYEPGIYVGGDATLHNYLHGKKPIVEFTVTADGVLVTALRFTEHCSNGQNTILSFESLGRGDPFVGRVQANGHFSATLNTNGETTLSGTLRGRAATVKATDQGPLSSDHKIICKGSHAFHATRTAATIQTRGGRS